MASFGRITFGASAATLAVGMAMAGAGAAGAQGSADLLGDLPDVVSDLELAAQALTGPVSVVPTAEGGPTVTYTNKVGVDQRCSGFTMPYSTVEEGGFDPGALEGASLTDLIDIGKIVYAGGGVAIMETDESGAPVSYDAGENSIFATVNYLIAKEGSSNRNRGFLLADGESVSWNAVAPTDEPAAVAVMCVPDDARTLTNLTFNIGVDKQVVADQINDRLGPLGSVGAGSVSGGSVELGAGALGSLAGDGGETP